MITKKQLRKLKYLNENLIECKMRIEELNSKMLSPKISQISLVAIHGGEISTTTTMLLNKKFELVEEYNGMLSELYSFQRTIEREVKKLDDDLQRVVHKRYFDGKSWEKIAKEMAYSLGTIHRKHRQALIILSKSDSKDKRVHDELMDNLFE